MISLCSNDYLGLANAPEVIAAATQALTARSFDVAGVRFVSGAQGLLGVAQRGGDFQNKLLILQRQIVIFWSLRTPYRRTHRSASRFAYGASRFAVGLGAARNSVSASSVAPGASSAG